MIQTKPSFGRYLKNTLVTAFQIGTIIVLAIFAVYSSWVIIFLVFQIYLLYNLLTSQIWKQSLFYDLLHKKEEPK